MERLIYEEQCVDYITIVYLLFVEVVPITTMRPDKLCEPLSARSCETIHRFII